MSIVVGWSKEQLRDLKKLWPNHPCAEVAKIIGKPTEATKKRASRMGLKKSKKYLKTVLHRS